MPQKLEFLSDHAPLPNVIVIFFWILVILCCEPWYLCYLLVLLCFIFKSLPFVYDISSQGSQSDERRHSLYSRFFISGRDIAALFRDCGPECQKCSDYSNQPIVSPLLKEESHNVYPLLDQCGMAVIVDQVTISGCSPSFLHTIYVFG